MDLLFVLFLVVFVVAAVAYWWFFMKKKSGSANGENRVDIKPDAGESAASPMDNSVMGGDSVVSATPQMPADGGEEEATSEEQ